jgi:aspartate/methionine/tyrosine aminotransferase
MAKGRPPVNAPARLTIERMFSRRTSWDRRTNRLALRLEELRRAGRPLLDLTETNPTRAGLLAPPDVPGLLADPAVLQYEPAPLGLASARDAVAADFRRRGVEVPPERIVLTASSSEAYALLFKLFADPGDAVLVPRPSYPLFDYLAGLESVEVAAYPLAYDGRWHLDRDALEAAVSPRTRAVVAVHPNNPTGSFLDRADAAFLHECCARHGLALIADEVFADYVWSPAADRGKSLLADGPALTFALGGLSKSCGLPQLKLGWIAVAGPPAPRDEALARLEIVADTYLSVGTPVQRAAPGILARLPELQAPIAARARANLDVVRAAVRGSAATLLEPQGGWSAVLRVPATLAEEEWVLALLDEAGVLVHPGYFFDFAGEAFLVLSLLPPGPALADGVSRLVHTVSRA